MKWFHQIKTAVIKKAEAVKNRVLKWASMGAVGASVSLATVRANAADAIDLTSITGAVSSADIVTGVLAIASTLTVAYMTIKAAQIVIRFMKGT